MSRLCEAGPALTGQAARLVAAGQDLHGQLGSAVAAEAARVERGSGARVPRAARVAGERLSAASAEGRLGHPQRTLLTVFTGILRSFSIARSSSTVWPSVVR